jgi:hypothetical protein
METFSQNKTAWMVSSGNKGTIIFQKPGVKLSKQDLQKTVPLNAELEKVQSANIATCVLLAKHLKAFLAVNY